MLKVFRKLAALLLTVLLTASSMSAGWTPPVPLGEVMPGLEEIFSDYNLKSGEKIGVIVELHEDPVALIEAAIRDKGMHIDTQDTQTWASALKKSQDTIKSHANRVGIRLNVLRQFTHVFNGIALEVPANQVALLSRVPGVKAVWPDLTVTADDLDISVPQIRTPLSLGLPEGYDGTGVVVAVIDTGIDYMHPDLGGGFGPAFTVIGGWDFVDDDAHPMETKNRPGVDAGGRAFNTSHGTHVAATLAAVAPGAKIIGVRVLGPTGSGSTADVMAGIEFSVQAGVHIANMSLGAAWGHPDSPWARVIDNAVTAGVVFVLSNGNSGPNHRTSGTYANSRLGIAVGNADGSPKIFARVGSVFGIGTPMTFSPAFRPLFGVEYGFVHVGLGRVQDFTVDVRGRIALIERGAISFAEKSRNARARGAVAAIIYNNVAGAFAGTLGAAQPGDIPTMSISREDGLALLAVVNRKMIFEEGLHTLVAGSSSRGPTPLLDINPDVSAPGIAITAAFPFPGSDGSHVPGAFQKVPGAGQPWYGTIGGTSMSAPHVAGGVAIMLQANPDLTPEDVKLALMNTAQDIRHASGLSFRPVDQGAGMIDVARAINPKLTIAPGALNFRMVSAGLTERSINLRSRADADVTYKVNVVKWVPGHDYNITTAETVTVPKGGSVEFGVTLEVGANLPVSVFDSTYDYTGFIYFVNEQDPNESYRIPFLFVNQMAISQVTTTPYYFSPNGDGILDTTTISLAVGSPIHRLRVMAAAEGFWRVIHLSPGALAPGPYSFEWNGRTLDNFTALDGFHTIHAQYQLVEGGPWIGGINTTATNMAGIFARVTIDRLPPDFYFVRPIVDLEAPGKVFVTGNVDDLMISLLQREGGNVYLNGEKLLVYSENVPSRPGLDWGVFTSNSFAADLTETVILNLRGEDKVGNVTDVTLGFETLSVTGPTTVETNETTYRVTGNVIPGVTLTIGGQPVSYDELGAYSFDYSLAPGVNTIEVVAAIPEWPGFAPIRKEITVTHRGIRLDTEKTHLITDEQYAVEVMVADVTDLFGVEFEVAFDNSRLSVVDVNPALEGIQVALGSVFAGRSVTVNVNRVDGGVVRLAATLNRGETGFTGSGQVAVITFRSRAPGLTTVSMTKAQGVTSVLQPIPAWGPSSVDVTGVGSGSIAGTVVLEGRVVAVGGVRVPRYAGVVVSWNGFRTTTNDAGEFRLPITGGGTFDLIVAMPGYVTSRVAVTVNGSTPAVTADFELLAGDINGDGEVSFADVALLAQALGSARGDANYNAAADINNDGTVNLVDLFVFSRNIGARPRAPRVRP